MDEIMKRISLLQSITIVTISHMVPKYKWVKLYVGVTEKNMLYGGREKGWRVENRSLALRGSRKQNVKNLTSQNFVTHAYVNECSETEFKLN